MSSESRRKALACDMTYPRLSVSTFTSPILAAFGPSSMMVKT